MAGVVYKTEAYDPLTLIIMPIIMNKLTGIILIENVYKAIHMPGYRLQLLYSNYMILQNILFGCVLIYCGFVN
ncbi:MAG TPA: hypothetical protein DD745_07795 [Bacteroidales bacterium]|nr:MAG: hypothetical protein A2132_02390 [Nitrospirae bacterium RBG_16_43_11]HBQ82767.1 hypothetical protein [Bacteroidales bacterium]